jgi:hypothetical protein
MDTSVYYRIIDYYGSENIIHRNDIGSRINWLETKDFNNWDWDNRRKVNLREEKKKRKPEFDRVYDNLIKAGKFADSFKWQRKKERKIIHDIKVMVSKK